MSETSWRSRIVGHADVAPTELIPHPLNWREHPPHQRAAVEGSIGEVGWVRSCLVNQRTGRLLDGHLRLALAIERGEPHVPVEYVDVSEDEERLILATLDPMAALATMNAERFAELTAALDVQNEALRDLLASLERPVMKAGLTDPDAIPEDVEPRAKRGELWELGDHRLLCGDATEGKDVVRVLPAKEQWSMLMITDPPYGVDYDPAWRVKAGFGSTGTARGLITNDDRADWREAWQLFPGVVAYVWHGGLHAAVVAESLQSCGYGLRAQIVWVKTRPPISRGHYHWQHEPVFFAVRDGADDGWRYDEEHAIASYAVMKGGIADWIGDRRQSTVWKIEHIQNETGHGSQKPVECMARPLRNHRGDVYDPFLGSGTTLIAAEQLGRKCYAIEIEPKYVDVALARWEQFTGKQAERVAESKPRDGKPRKR